MRSRSHHTPSWNCNVLWKSLHTNTGTPTEFSFRESVQEYPHNGLFWLEIRFLRKVFSSATRQVETNVKTWKQICTGVFFVKYKYIVQPEDRKHLSNCVKDATNAQKTLTICEHEVDSTKGALRTEQHWKLGQVLWDTSCPAVFSRFQPTHEQYSWKLLWHQRTSD